MKDVLTPKDLAAAIGVSESSLRRWVDAGTLQTARTVGGHRRIPLAEAIRFIRDSRATVVRPDLLGLPPVSRLANPHSETDRLYDALAAGDASLARGVVLSLYLTGSPIASILDGPLSDSLRRVGTLYQHSPQGILTEHRATDIAIQILSHLRHLLPTPPDGAPLAMGGSPPGDIYLLPGQMVATTLADCGYRVLNYGPDTPLYTLADAAEQAHPRLCYLSITSASAAASLPPGVIDTLATRLAKAGSLLLLGGQQFPAVSFARHPNLHALPTLTDLASLARNAATAAN